MIRADFIFPYWIFIWYILYIVLGRNIISNPKIALECGIIYNIITIFYMLKFKTRSRIILSYSLIMVLIKIIPLYTILETKTVTDDYYSVYILFCCYLYWLNHNKQPISRFITDTNNMIKSNTIILPGMITLDKFLPRFDI